MTKDARYYQLTAFLQVFAKCRTVALINKLMCFPIANAKGVSPLVFLRCITFAYRRILVGGWSARYPTGSADFYGYFWKNWQPTLIGASN